MHQIRVGGGPAQNPEVFVPQVFAPRGLVPRFRRAGALFIPLVLLFLLLLPFPTFAVPAKNDGLPADLPMPAEAKAWFDTQAQTAARKLIDAKAPASPVAANQASEEQIVIGSPAAVLTWSADYLHGVENPYNSFDYLPVWVAPVSYRSVNYGVVAWVKNLSDLTPKSFSVNHARLAREFALKSAEPSVSASPEANEQNFETAQLVAGGGAYRLTKLAGALVRGAQSGTVKALFDAQLDAWFSYVPGAITPASSRASLFVSGPASPEQLQSFVRLWWGSAPSAAPLLAEVDQPSFSLDFRLMLVVTVLVIAVLAWLVIYPIRRRHIAALSSYDPDLVWISDEATPTIPPPPVTSGSAAEAHRARFIMRSRRENNAKNGKDIK